MFSLSQEKQEEIRALYEKNPSMMLHEMAQKLHVSEADIAYYSEDTRVFTTPDNFDTIWNAMITWEKVTYIVVTKNVITEVHCKLPAGKYGHGFFNPMGDSPLGGHIRTDAIGAICFLSKPFFGLESHSVQFFDTEGNHMFAIYVGRENRELIPSVKEAFLQLKQDFQCK